MLSAHLYPQRCTGPGTWGSLLLHTHLRRQGAGLGAEGRGHYVGASEDTMRQPTRDTSVPAPRHWHQPACVEPCRGTPGSAVRAQAGKPWELAVGGLGTQRRAEPQVGVYIAARPLGTTFSQQGWGPSRKLGGDRSSGRTPPAALGTALPSSPHPGLWTTPTLTSAPEPPGLQPIVPPTSRTSLS